MEVVDAMLARQDLHRLRLQKVALQGLSAGGAAHVAVMPTQHQEGAIGKAQHKLFVGPYSRKELRRPGGGGGRWPGDREAEGKGDWHTEPGGAPEAPIS